MNEQKSRFLERLVEVAHSVSRPILLRFCNRLDALPDNAPEGEWKNLVNDIPNAEARNLLRGLLNIRLPETSLREISWALRAASEMDEYHRNSQSLELVWTGPSPVGCKLRRTEQVLLDLIQSARKSLMIVTFAAYDIPRIAKVLRDAAERNVRITLILESSDLSAGKLTIGALEALDSTIKNRAEVYVWPMNKREKNERGQYGSLHVKCAVADNCDALISSANLTGYALSLNMELGLFIRKGSIPKSISNHLRSLITEGFLVSMPCRSD